ncbi:MAG: hypothetical protein KatS3mg110_3019 [Pirellulaceae bacterium]|nr:MAG: hypothetical protein KatS3mg110_3019 [Pirellulaceae bacterium]
MIPLTAGWYSKCQEHSGQSEQFVLASGTSRTSTVTRISLVSDAHLGRPAAIGVSSQQRVYYFVQEFVDLFDGPPHEPLRIAQ